MKHALVRSQKPTEGRALHPVTSAAVHAVELSFDSADVADASSGTVSHVRSEKEAIAYLALSAVLTCAFQDISKHC